MFVNKATFLPVPVHVPERDRKEISIRDGFPVQGLLLGNGNVYG